MCCMCMHKLSFCPAKIAFFAIYHKQMAENCSLLLFFLFSSQYLKEKCGFRGVNIPRQVSKHTLPFIFRYFAIYVNILF